MNNLPNFSGSDSVPATFPAVAGQGAYQGAGTALSTHVRRAEFEASPSDLTLVDLLTILRRYWPLVVGFALAGLALAGAYAWLSTPLYQASTTVEVSGQDAEIVEGSAVPSIVADNEFIATQFAILQSRELARRVASLPEVAALADGAAGDVSGNLAARIDARAEGILAGLDVERVQNSHILRISSQSPDPALAAATANGLAQSLIGINLERRFNTTEYARDYLTEQLAGAKARLEEAERRVAAYATEQDLIDVGNTAAGGLGGETLSFLNTQLAEAETALLEARQRLAAARAAGEGLAEADPTLERLEAQRLELQIALQQELIERQPQHPAVVALQQQVASLDTAIANREGELLARSTTEQQLEVRSLDGEVAAAREVVVSLRARIAELSTTIQDERSRRIDYTILQREVDAARLQYESLLQRSQEVELAGGVSISQLSVLDTAKVPVSAHWPNIPLVLAAGLLLGLILGSLVALVRYLLDDSIKMPDDVKTKLGLPLLGVVPKVDNAQNFVLEAMDTEHSPYLESLFSIRTALSYATSSGVPKSLLLTSTQPNEGKTNISTALALTFAKLDYRVLLIDADMRKPSITSKPEHSIGLSGLLVSDAELQSAVLNASVAPNLWVLPAGNVPPNPAQLLSTGRIAEVIREAEDAYDVVIVDAPPLMGFTDAPSLAAACSAAVLIVKADAIRTRAARASLDRLSDSRATVIGAILTQYDAKKAKRGYGYYGYGYSQYGAYGQDTKSSGRDKKVAARKSVDLFIESADG